jgi:hypothetical protein
MQTNITNVDLMEAKTNDEVGVGDDHDAPLEQEQIHVMMEETEAAVL